MQLNTFLIVTVLFYTSHLLPFHVSLKIELSLILVNIRFHLFRVFGIIIEGDIRLRRKHWNQFYYFLKCYWHFSINSKCFWHFSINSKCSFYQKDTIKILKFFLLRKFNVVFLLSWQGLFIWQLNHASTFIHTKKRVDKNPDE